jgi:hypothetical protein
MSKFITFLICITLFAPTADVRAEVPLCGPPFPCNLFSSDFNAKTIWYLKDGQLVSKNVARTKTTVTWAKDNITKTTRYDYADKSTHSLSETVEPTVTVTISGMVKTTTTKFGNPAAKPVIKTETGVLIADSVSLSGDLSMKTARYRFKDGGEALVNTNRTKTTVTWAKDNITKTTRYDYADKSTHSLSETVEPTVTVTWASNNITKTTVTVFGNGIRNTSVINVQPTESTVQYSDAIYPSTWASGNGGVVTPPDVSDRLKVYGTGHIEVLENGSSSLPFLQSTLSVRNISDPNSFVKTNTSLYDLTWGIPDSEGPKAASTYRNAGSSLKLSKSMLIAGYEIVGVCGNYACGGPTFKRPADDVLKAWDQGWTGKGSNVLIIDSFSKQSGYGKSDSDFHGIYVSALVGMTAISSNVWTLDFNYPSWMSPAFNGGRVGGKVHAVNMSFDYRSEAGRPTARDWVSFAQDNSINVRFPSVSLIDAVLVKAAGNDNKALSVLGSMTILTDELASNTDTAKRLLLVGALDSDGSVGAKANKASYSNTPGTNQKFQSRFVLANGTSPFSSAFGWDLTYDPGNGVGTSYAAPRVAGYIGILRHKFPNLNAEKSASIILDTARYDTLNCYPNCNPAVYGRGEASLSRALAPVGKLR